MLGCRSLEMIGLSTSRSTRTRGPFGSKTSWAVLNGTSSLGERHFAAVVRGLLDGVDQAVQLDRGRKSRVIALTTADRFGEQRVHLADIDGFTRRRSGCGQGKALRHLDRRQRIAAL